MTRSGLVAFQKLATAVTEELWPGTVTISGTDYAAAVANSAEGGSLGLGGEVLESVLKVRIRKALLATKPAHGETTLTFEGAVWRVDEVTDDRVSESWYLTCVPANE